MSEEKRETIYRRVILKVSGEAFRNRKETGTFNMHAVERLAKEIISVHKKGVEIGVVIGGGNIVRGRDLQNIEQVTGDHMGMLATVINMLYLQKVLERQSVEVRIQTAINIGDIAPYPYVPAKSNSYLQKGRIVLFGGGAGICYCTTDNTAVRRALELNADAILKGTKVDGIYEKYPPATDKDKPITATSYQIAKDMDLGDLFDKAALQLLIEKRAKIPIHVFNIFQAGNILRILKGEEIGSRILP